MSCPICFHTETRVIRKLGNRRRLKCERCGYRWPTREILETELEELVEIKKTAVKLRELLPQE